MEDLEEVSPITTFTSPSSFTSSFNSNSSSEGGTFSNSSVEFNNSKQLKQSWPRHSSLLKLEHFFQFCILFWGEKNLTSTWAKWLRCRNEFRATQIGADTCRHTRVTQRDATWRRATSTLEGRAAVAYEGKTILKLHLCEDGAGLQLAKQTQSFFGNFFLLGN